MKTGTLVRVHTTNGGDITGRIARWEGPSYPLFITETPVGSFCIGADRVRSVEEVI